MDKILVIYHNDLDGKCAAAIVNKAWKNENVKIEFLPIDYPNELPKKVFSNYMIVYVLDFCFSPENMKFIKDNTNLIWIDHHITSIEKMKNINIHKSIDISMSGCLLTWKFFYGDDEPPLPIQYIDAIDLYEMDKKEGSREFREYSFLQDTNPESEIWDKWISPIIDKKYLGKEAGKYIIDYQLKMIQQAIIELGEEIFIDGYKCLKINWSDVFTSSIMGNEIIKMGYDIAWIYKYKKGKIIYNSLYSEKNGKVDVSEIAKRFGGGGHKSAAGFIKEL